MGGTTFPFLALEFLTGGRLHPDGLFRSPRGQAKFYVATDSLTSPRYRGPLPEDLIEVAVEDNLFFEPSTETGVLFHMIGALSEHGKLGLIAIGSSSEDAQELFDQAVGVLDRIGGEPTVTDHAHAERELPFTLRRID